MSEAIAQQERELASSLCSDSCQRIMPDTENVLSSVHVTIMYRPAIARPFSYTQTLSAFRTAQASALRTGLSRVSFIHFNVPCAIRNRLVRKHLFEGMPANIGYGFTHPRFLKAGTVDAANDNQVIFGNNIVSGFVQEVSALRFNLIVYLFSLSLLTRSLGFGKALFGLTEELRSFNHRTVRERCEVFKAQINAHGLLWRSLLGFGQFNHDIEKPPSSRILREARAITDFGTVRDFARKKNAVDLSVEEKSTLLRLKVLSLNGYPAKRLLTPVTQIRAAVLSARSCVLLSYGVDTLGRQRKIIGGPRKLIGKRKTTRPNLPPFERMFLHIVAVIPNVINLAGHAAQSPAVLVFNAIFVGNFHAKIIGENHV